MVPERRFSLPLPSPSEAHHTAARLATGRPGLSVFSVRPAALETLTPFPLPTTESLLRNVVQELSLFLESLDTEAPLVPTPRVFLTHWEDQLRRAVFLAQAEVPLRLDLDEAVVQDHVAAPAREV